jgi:hypothetical protein
MTLPRKHTRCPNCHHRNDYKRRSGDQRQHRCHSNVPSKRGNGKEGVSGIKVVGKQSRGG